MGGTLKQSCFSMRLTGWETIEQIPSTHEAYGCDTTANAANRSKTTLCRKWGEGRGQTTDGMNMPVTASSQLVIVGMLLFWPFSNNSERRV